MWYLVAILLPPLAVLRAGKPFQFVLNIGLTICLWVPGVIHAFMVTNNMYQDKRTNRIIKGMRR